MPLSLKRFTPRITIERLRTLVLVGAGVLVLAIAGFLGFGQWKLHRFLKDVPKRLGIDISQEANGVNYTQSRKGKTLFKIHAARAVQMKTSGKTLLHDVRIDLYGDDGQRSDTISGSEFEYDPAAGLAQAAGAVNITLMRPGVKPAIAQLKPSPAPPGVANAIPSAISDTEIHVKTSGLLFNQKTGVATTTQRVDFALRQGTGSSTGATYDSAQGQLILDRSVELHVNRGATPSARGPVTVHASHAEFERDQQLCTLSSAVADYNGGSATTGNALIHFRDDGSVLRLDGSGGVDLKTHTGGHVTAPRGTMDFDEQNHPHTGILEGGARLEVAQPNRTVEGAAPTARLAFDGAGQLHLAHLEQGVAFSTQQSITTAKGATGKVVRNWHSQSADIAFAAVPSPRGNVPGNTAKVEPRTIHGLGGVVLHSETTVNGVLTPSQLAADTVTAELSPGGILSSLVGIGHTSFDQQTAKGVRQSSSSDQLEVKFLPPSPAAKSKTDSEIASILQIGHVILIQNAAKPGASAVRATANRADYDGPTELLHLTGTPRIQNGSLDMTANQIDFARATGDAFAHGDVKASWSSRPAAGNGAMSDPLPGASLLGGGSSGEPVHAIAAEAELHQATEEVVFRSASSASKSPSGNLPRLWQGASSVAAPLITLNRQKQTLVALGASPASNSSPASNTSPVQTVLLTNARPRSSPAGAIPAPPSILRLRSGELHYSEAERVALFSGGAVGHVTAETTGENGPATVVSQQAEVKLFPAGIHPAPRTTPAGNATQNSAQNSSQNSSVDQMIATGHVTVDWPDRRGTGEKLVYLSEDGAFTLTGSAAMPPRITDQTRGTVTGSALIFHSRDDSVTVEGDGGKTTTETQSPKRQPK